MRLAFLSIGLLILSSCAMTGKKFVHNGEQVPFGTDTIIVHLDKSPKEAFKHVKSSLLKSGFSFQFVDDESMSLSTHFLAIKNTLNAKVSLRANVEKQDNGSVVYLGGNFSNPNLLHVAAPEQVTGIELYGLTNSFYRLAWDELYTESVKLGGELQFKSRTRSAASERQ